MLSTTGIVYEDPSAKINTVVGAPNGTVCCDGSTGLWRASDVQTDTPPTNPICRAEPGDSGKINTRADGSGSVSGFDVVLTPS